MQVSSRQFNENVFQAAERGLEAALAQGQFNTVVYEEEDLYRGNGRRDVVMMSGEDGARLRLLLYLFERDDAVRLMRAG